MPSICRADGVPDIATALAKFELPFPDARLELDYQTNDASLMVAWLFAVQLHSGGCSSFREREDSISHFIDASAEYQLQFGDWESRGVGAFRGGFLFRKLGLPVGPTAEVGGVVGTDGNGVMVGGGLVGTDGSGGMLGTGLVLAFDRHHNSITSLAAVYRRTWTSEGERHDVSLNLRYAP